MKLISLILLAYSFLLARPTLASVPNGAATLSLSPSTSQIQLNQTINIKVLVNTANLDIDGIQFKIKVEGTATIGFQANQVSGLRVITNKVDGNTVSYTAITEQPQLPFSSISNTQISVITITPTNSFNLIFDPSYSKITKHQTGEDILLTPTNGQYSLAQSANTSSSSSTPTPSPTPVSTLTNPTSTLKTSTKTTPKTTPSPTIPAPTGTPIPLLSKLFSRTPQPSPLSYDSGSTEIPPGEIPPFPWKIITLLSILMVAAAGFTIWIWKKMRQNNPLQSITPPPTITSPS
jgi:hypothetical protein